MPENVIDVSVVILFDGPRMLVNKRPEGSYFGGWWEWPGGKRNPGETALQCAQRELAEEIGFADAKLSEYATETAEYPGRKVRLTVFVGRRPTGNANQDALEHQWLEPAEVVKLQFLEANRPVLRRLMDSPPDLPE